MSITTLAQRMNPEPSPIERAFTNYTEMEAQLQITLQRNNELQIENGKLVAEIDMVREMLGRADTDRIRLQMISSTLLGRLLAINDCIAGAVKESIKNGIEAAIAHNSEPETATGEAADPVQSADPAPAPATAPAATATPVPPHAGLKE